MLNLVRFAEELVSRIENLDPDDLDSGSYFMTLVYLEDIFDKYGRSYEWCGKSRGDVTREMDRIRSMLAQYKITPDFQAAKASKIEQFQREW